MVQRGVNKIVTVELLSDKQRELVDEARKLAIEDAKRKARFLSSQAGWQLLGIKDIRFNEEPYRKGRLARTHGTRASYSGDSGAEAAETFVDSSMTVAFEYRRQERKP
ncbi:MAG: SIMPL domain-containing protein [Planctomycetota bacterium]